MYAEPLYKANLTVGGTVRNVVVIATEHDSVFAFDADAPTCTQLWQTSFLGPGVTTMPWTDTANLPAGPYYQATNDVFPEIGITSTPVIDPATNTLYVVAKTKESVGTGCSAGSPCYVQRLHALDLATGLEKLGGPVVITAANFVPLRHLNRPALLLNNGTIYVAFGSHGDNPVYQGWLFGYNATTLARTFAIPTTDPTGNPQGTPNCGMCGGVWQSGAGPVVDPSGNVYIVTGNGSFNVDTGGHNYSDSVLKLSATGTLLDYFAPFQQSTLNVNDVDLGSAGAVILPDTVASPALLGQTNLGQFHPGGAQVVQEVPVQFNTTNLDGGIFGSVAYWNGNIYVAEVGDALRQFTIANGALSTSSVSNTSTTFPLRGAIPVVSANGTSGGVVWVLDLSGWQSGQPAVLNAYDATNLATLLYSSPVSGPGAADGAVKFTLPTVANGKVYVPGQASFTVFGLLPR